jgi:hypothetical protein
MRIYQKLFSFAKIGISLLVLILPLKGFTQGKELPRKLIYESYVEVLEEAHSSQPSRLDSMLTASFDPKTMDSAAFKILSSDDFWKDQADHSRSEVIYEIYPNEVWVYSQWNGQQAGNTFRYRQGSHLAEEYDQSRKILKRNFVAIPEPTNSNEAVFKDEISEYLELEIYKIVETELDPEMGKSIHALQVTDEIKLPVKINLGVGPQLRDQLIVERITTSEAFPKMRFVYRLKEVIYDEDLK